MSLSTSSSSVHTFTYLYLWSLLLLLCPWKGSYGLLGRSCLHLRCLAKHASTLVHVHKLLKFSFLDIPYVPLGLPHIERLKGRHVLDSLPCRRGCCPTHPGCCTLAQSRHQQIFPLLVTSLVEAGAVQVISLGEPKLISEQDRVHPMDNVFGPPNGLLYRLFVGSTHCCEHIL